MVLERLPRRVLPPCPVATVPAMSRTLKVVVIGDSDAGKTALRTRYLAETFQPAYRATIGADFYSKTIDVTVPVPGHEHRQSTTCQSRKKGAAADTKPKDPVASTSSAAGEAAATSNEEGADDLVTRTRTEKFRITLQVWDTAGQERFKSLGTAFYRGADAVIVAWDVSKRTALARTQTWFRDFCALGDLGLPDDDASLAQSNPRQAREAREKRQRFCWVAVGCKGDLLEGLREGDEGAAGSVSAHAQEESAFTGTGWTESRRFFDELMPRYLPPAAKERNAFAQPEQRPLPTSAKPYAIDTEAPARPEDVLSRPSPHSRLEQGEQKAPTASESEGARHPDAGTPPGTRIEAVGKASPLLPSSRQKGKESRRSLDVWQPERSAESQQYTTSAFQRSRYDSATSLGAPSVYYSVHGGSTIFNHSTGKTDGSSSTTSTLTVHPKKEDPSDHETSARVEGSDSRPQNRMKGTESNSEQEEKITRRRSARRSTEHSAKTIRQAAKGREDQPSEEASEIDDSSAVVNAVPSGDPIPFPSEEDALDELSAHDLDHGALHRRYKRKSKLSTSQSRRSRLDSSRSRNVSQIAATVKEDQDEQSTDVVGKRQTLYSAPPSSCGSTIRAADEGISTRISDDERTKDLAPHLAGDTEANADSDLNSSPPSSLHDSEYEADEGELFSAAHVEEGFRLFFTSAKDGVGIDDVFVHIARRVAMNWAYDEWDEARRRRMWGYAPDGAVRTAPPADEERERERMRRAIKISAGKGTGDCCW